MNITLKQLRAFVAVAQEGSFTRAGEKLHVTQSTLTSSIRILEEEIGMRLFDRSTRTVGLTLQGAKFLPAADRMLRDLAEALDEMKMTAQRQRGTAVVAAAASFINYVLTPAMIRMANSYPGVSVRLREETTEGVCRLLASGEADFGVTTLFSKVPELDASLILRDTYGAVFSKDHELRLEGSPLSWNRLSGHRMVGLHRSNGIRELIDQHPRIAAEFKAPAYEVGSMPSLLPLLEKGFGYAALPALAAQPLVSSGLVYARLSRPALQRELFAVKKKGRSLSPAASAFLEAMTESLGAIKADRDMEIAFGWPEMKRFRNGGAQE
jgi:DNA-binding transcriptional LysR family regulator